jgi:hypothetical protein
MHIHNTIHQLSLVPPSISALFALNPYPGAHPNARQASKHKRHSQQVLQQQQQQVQVDGDGVIINEAMKGGGGGGGFHEVDELLVRIGKLELTLDAGEAVWIPAGWFHEVYSDFLPVTTATATESAHVQTRLNYTASVAITVNTHELAEFKNWLVGDGALTLPPG